MSSLPVSGRRQISYLRVCVCVLFIYVYDQLGVGGGKILSQIGEAADMFLGGPGGSDVKAGEKLCKGVGA